MDWTDELIDIGGKCMNDLGFVAGTSDDSGCTPDSVSPPT